MKTLIQATQTESSCTPVCEAPPRRGRGRPRTYHGEAVPLTQELLRELLDYNAETGELTWRVSNGSARAGMRAGRTGTGGYYNIGIYGREYKAHRLAWLWVHGRLPVAQLDHVNGDRSDNRTANLRECTNSENQQNRKLNKNSTSGYTGVTFNRDGGTYRAVINAAGKYKHLGCFATPELAHAAYLRAKAALHTFNPVPRAS